MSFRGIMIITQLKFKVAPNLLPKVESWYSKLSLNGHTPFTVKNFASFNGCKLHSNMSQNETFSLIFHGHKVHLPVLLGPFTN